MTHATDILTLARWMSADFSNQAQAFENPPFFAHIRVGMRPLPLELFGGVSIFVEQAYDYIINQPYRVRVLNLIIKNDHIEIENYTINPENQFYGASRNPSKLQEITLSHLTKLPCCNMIAEWTGSGFKGHVEPGKNYEAKMRKGAKRFHSIIRLFYDHHFIDQMTKAMSLKNTARSFTSAIAGDVWNDENSVFEQGVL